MAAGPALRRKVMDEKIKKLTMSALLAALTAVSVLVVQIPMPGTGYLNLGDGIVLLCGLLLGPLYGAAAAGIGSAIADLISGYVIYAPATLVIKGLTAVTAYKVFKALSGKDGGGAIAKNAISEEARKKVVPHTVFSGIIGELVMVIGYLLYEGLVVLRGGSLAASFSAALSSVPFNLIQGAAGVLASAILHPLLLRIIRRQAAGE